MFPAGAVTAYLLVCILSLLFTFVWTKLYQSNGLPPGPVPLPLIGNLHQIKTTDMVKSLKNLSEKYGPVYTLHLGLRRVVVIWGYDALKEALVDHAEEFSGRGRLPTFDMVLKDYGINGGNYNRWKVLRPFSVITLRNFGMGKKSIEERIQEEAGYLIQEFKNTKELAFNPTLYISKAVSNVICSTIFGNRFEYQDKEFQRLLEAINTSFELSSSLPGQLYSMYTDIMKYLPGPHNNIRDSLICLEKFVERRVKINQETLDLNSPRDFIDCFLIKMEKEKQNPSTEFFMKNLVSLVLGLFLAGTETVSTTIRFSLLLLVKHPEIQEKVLAEIDHVIGRTRIPSIEDRRKMPYTDAVVHEIQRISTVAPLGLPHSVIRDTKFRGFTLPKGTEVFTILASALWDPTKFSDPESFNPGHFLDENGRFKKNDAFIPFSTGKRVCAGEALARMELFIYITTIVQNFKLKYPGDPKEIDTRPTWESIISIPMNFEIQMIPR